MKLLKFVSIKIKNIRWKSLLINFGIWAVSTAVISVIAYGIYYYFRYIPAQNEYRELRSGFNADAFIEDLKNKVSAQANQSEYIDGNYNIGDYEVTHEINPIDQNGSDSSSIQIPYNEYIASLKKKNSDVVGFIIAEGIEEIRYPIVRGEDNIFYLDHTVMKAKSAAGAIFMDSGSAADFSSSNTIIYGHHMKDKSMFAQLDQYKTKSFFNEHDMIYIISEERVFAYQIFGEQVVLDDYDYRQTSFVNNEEKINYFNKLWEDSWNKRNVTFTGDSQILTLSTCAYTPPDTRMVVHAVLLYTEDIAK